MDSITIKINGKDYILPWEILKKTHKHQKPKNWVSFWFYKNRKKTYINKKNIKDDLIITSINDYKKGIFYKMCAASKEDKYFDFYFRLKDGIGKNIPVPSRRVKCKKKNGNNLIRIKNEYIYQVPELNSDGKILVNFD